VEKAVTGSVLKGGSQRLAKFFRQGGALMVPAFCRLKARRTVRRELGKDSRNFSGTAGALTLLSRWDGAWTKAE